MTNDLVRKMKDKLTAAIVEDDKVFAEILRNRVEQQAQKYDLDLAITCFEKPQALESQNMVFDLLFMDIEFPEENGIAWAQKWQGIKKFGNIIFVSAYDEYVFDSFGSNPVAFVRKAHLNEDMEKAMELYQKKRTELTLGVPIWEGKKVHFVDISEIVYLKGSGHYIEFYSKNGLTKVLRGKMDGMYEALGKYGFVRVQVSYLLNAKYIIGMKDNRITICDNQTFRISPKYRKALLEQMKLLWTELGE